MATRAKPAAQAEVYFLPVADGEPDASIAEKTVRLMGAAGFERALAPKKLRAVKQHFGEGTNDGYVKPAVTRAVVGFIRKAGARPFVTDSNTLYRGRRGQADEHLQMAAEHGFTQESLGAPVIIADGLVGVDQVTVPIEGGKHFKETRIASAGYHAASCIVLTHVKGHCNMGFGGSIKNVGMGFAARAGKLSQHHGGNPIFIREKCTACGTCVEWCPTDAIELPDKAKLIPDRCIGCGECYALCPSEAIGFKWGEAGPVLIEKVCEHTLGFLKNKRNRVGYLNLVIHVTKDCDCMGGRQKPGYPNLGIFASTDIIAVDKAAADFSVKKYGKDIWSAWWPESEYEEQFRYGEKIGLGTTNYKLIEL